MLKKGAEVSGEAFSNKQKRSDGKPHGSQLAARTPEFGGRSRGMAGTLLNPHPCPVPNDRIPIPIHLPTPRQGHHPP